MTVRDTSVTLIGALAYPLHDRPGGGKSVCELLIGGEIAGSDGSIFSSFVPVKAFGLLAEDAQRCLRPGTPVIIHGELEMNSYGGRDSTEIIAGRIEVLPDLTGMVIWEDVDNSHGRRARLPLESCMNEIEQMVNLTADPERKSEGLVIARCGWNSWMRANAPGEEGTKKAHYGELRGIDEVGDALMSFSKGQRLLVRSRAYLRIHAVRGSSRQNRTIQSEVYYIETSVRLRTFGQDMQASAEHGQQTPEQGTPQPPVMQTPGTASAQPGGPASVPTSVPAAPSELAHDSVSGVPVTPPPDLGGTGLPPVMPQPPAHLPSFPLPRGPQQAPSGLAVGSVVTLPPDTEAQPIPALLRPAFGQFPAPGEEPITPVNLDSSTLDTEQLDTEELDTEELDMDEFTPEDEGHPDLGEYDL